MEPESLSLEENHREVQELDVRVRLRGGRNVLTLEEIANLAAEEGQPADTLMNVVALIAKRFETDVCSAYLLEPDRANLVLAATVGLRRECIGNLRMAIHEGLAGLVAEQVGPVAVEQPQNHPRFKYFGEAGEDAYQSFLGVPLIDRGILQGVLIVQTVEPRAFRDEEIQMLTEAAAQVAPIVSEARTLDRFIAPGQERLWTLARNLWWSWDHDTVGLFRDLDPLRWRQLNQNPVSLLAEYPLAKLETRAAELVLHSRINYAYRRLQEYLQADRTWGTRHAGILRPRPVAYFSAEFGFTNRSRFIPEVSECLPETISRARPIWNSAGRRRIVLRTGLFPAAPGSRWLAAGRIPGDRCQSIAFGDCDWHERPAGCRSNRNPHGSIHAKVWRVNVGRCDLFLLDSDVEANAPDDRELTSRLYGGDARTRIRQELLLGVGGFRALRAMGITPGVLHLNEGHSGFVVLEAIRIANAGGGYRFDNAVPRASRGSNFYHSYSRACRP